MARNLVGALALLRQFEQGPKGGPALTAYRCPAGKWTIGYGHTGPDVKPGLTITEAQAEIILQHDAELFSARVEAKCPNATDAQHAALVCFAFNCKGWDGPNCSVIRLHNAGNYAGAGRAFALWNKAHNDAGELVELRGLTRRRAAEAALYLSDDGRADPQRTRAGEVTGEKPLAASRTINAQATAGGAVAAAEAVNQLKDAQGMLEPLAAYSDTIRFLFLAVAVLAIGATVWFRYQERKAGRA